MLIFNKYKVNQNIKITAFEKKKFCSLLNIKGSGSALTRPWPDPTGPGSSLPRGQGQAEGGPALRVRVRASKNGLDPARPGPWTVYSGGLSVTVRPVMISDFQSRHVSEKDQASTVINLCSAE